MENQADLEKRLHLNHDDTPSRHIGLGFKDKMPQPQESDTIYKYFVPLFEGIIARQSFQVRSSNVSASPLVDWSRK